MSIISHTKAEGSDVAMLVEMLQEVLDGVPDGHQLIALLATALVLQKPDLTEEQVRDGVKDVSQYTCLWLDGLKPEPLTEEEKKRMVN